MRVAAEAMPLGVASQLIFEIVIPQGAETVGTYQADFYAGTPAVTRNAFGAGHSWYVACDLDQEGVRTDLLTGTRIERGQPITLDPHAVIVLCEDP